MQVLQKRSRTEEIIPDPAPNVQTVKKAIIINNNQPKGGKRMYAAPTPNDDDQIPLLPLILLTQTGTNSSPQRRTTNIPPTNNPTPATMLTFPGSLSGAKTCVRKKRDHALSFGSTSEPPPLRASCAGV